MYFVLFEWNKKKSWRNTNYSAINNRANRWIKQMDSDWNSKVINPFTRALSDRTGLENAGLGRERAARFTCKIEVMESV